MASTLSAMSDGLCVDPTFSSAASSSTASAQPQSQPAGHARARGGPSAPASNRQQQQQQLSRLPIRPTSPVGRQAEPLLPNQIPMTIASGRLDPFEARPRSHEPAPSVDALMSHYLTTLAYRSFPFYTSRPLIEIWWPFVRADDVLFHVILLLSGLDREHLQQQHDSVHSRQLLDQCLSLLQARILTPEGVNDGTLVAIASLAAMEHDRGNMRALDMHLEGLKRVVELRGGLDAIRRTNSMAANVVFWCAMVSINEPMLLPVSYGDHERDVDWLNNPETASLLTHDGSEKDLTEYGVDVPTANILHEVQRLSRDYTSKVNYGIASEAATLLSYLCSVLERLLQMSRSPTHDSPIPGLSRSCRLAGCLHVFTPMSGYFPDPTLMLHQLVRDLKSSLTHMIRAVGTRSHLLLWLLSVGGITAHKMPERGWFGGHLVVVITDLGIEDWLGMRQHLIKLAFHDNFCDESFGLLWREVRARQELLNVAPVPPTQPLTEWCDETLRSGAGGS
ncbi:hypothetical protein LTR35_011279 [Friedmanniomyces endolithicus]|nr:hypothetical protein LTR35_011279 [Friedmanniomyces endolithicus]KAK0292179.1 hypothetical protein LTS00_008014 [Friedmanniomyces endolithicus]KAK0986276.1 hypothetical protein LTR54_013447 [Friedmanniomyces endolithicus]